MGQADEQLAGQDQKTRRLRFGGHGPRMRSVVVAAGIIGVVAAPMGVAATGDALREGARNGTASRETEIISNNGATTGTKGGYSTRQSNLSSSGGGAIYGCRSGAGASNANPPRNPCLRANNLSTGKAFEFNATSGDIVGTINAQNGGDSKKPFTTNATGVATGLNADRVDGQNAADIQKAATDAAVAAAATDATTKANDAKTRFVLVNAAGEIEAQSGGFRVVVAYPAPPSPAQYNVYIDSGEDLTDKGINATIALQNQVNQGGGTMNGTDSNPPVEGDTFEFGGEISAARCLTAGIVACAPAGTGSPNVFVVSPRQSDGTGTDPGERKRFYASIVG